MSFLIVLAALVFLMYVAYRGHSVILFAPIAALGAVMLTDPSLVAPMFTGLFMDKMVGPDFEAGLANLKALAEKP